MQIHLLSAQMVMENVISVVIFITTGYVFSMNSENTMPETIHFTDLGLSDETLRALTEAGYTTPTPIQEKSIPIILMGRDMVGCAQTGTGKTAAFVLPLVDILSGSRSRARMPRSLILAPTRELASQIADNFAKYSKYHSLQWALLTGGDGMDEQIRALDRGVDVLIATPGRLLDHFERGRILLSDVKIFVIDECDRMLDMGFIPDIERITGMLPQMRQTLMFSATMAPEIRKLAEKFLQNPREVSVASNASAVTITQELYYVAERQKRELLRHLLRSKEVHNAYIFCNRKRDVAVLAGSLKRHGFNVGELHGDMAQSKRYEALADFKSGKMEMMVCSDVAARGLDIPDVACVVNFDIPFNSEDYVHRIGRTGRAGKLGLSLSFATPSDAPLLENIFTLTGKRVEPTSVPGLTLDSLDTGEAAPPARSQGRGGRTSKSKSPPPASARPPRAVPARQPAPAILPPPQPQRRPVEPMPAPESAGFGDDVPAFLRR